MLILKDYFQVINRFCLKFIC